MRYSMIKYVKSFRRSTSSKRLFSTSLLLSKKRNVTLSYDTYDQDCDSTKSPVVLLHGLFGSKLNWQSHCREIQRSTKRKVIAYDAVNHGRSSHHHEMSYTNMAEDLVSLLDLLKIEQAITIGHSMGGKTVMANALLYGDRVEKLIVVDSAPSVSKSMGEVRDYLDAMMAIDLNNINSRKDVDIALEKAAKSNSIRQFLMTNLLKGSDGKYYWRVNLEAISSYYWEHIHSFPPIKSTFENKTLFVGGGRSNYISKEKNDDIYGYFPKATIQHIPGAGHWVHSEKPKEFLQTVIPFIEEK